MLEEYFFFDTIYNPVTLKTVFERMRDLCKLGKSQKSWVCCWTLYANFVLKWQMQTFQDNFTFFFLLVIIAHKFLFLTSSRWLGRNVCGVHIQRCSQPGR